MKKKPAKQFIREQQLERERVTKEFEANHDKLQQDWEGLEEIWKKVFSPPISKEEFVSRELEKWEREQPLIITGKYQDWEKVVSTYQQRFVEFTCQLCPNVIEELRPLVPYFDVLFGEKKTHYNSLFNWFNMSILVRQNQSLDTYINSLMRKSTTPLYPLLEFRPYRINKFRYDYKWGEFRVLFYFLFWLFPLKEKMDLSELQEKKSETIKLLKENLILNRDHPGFPKQLNEETLQKAIQFESERIFAEFLMNPKDAYFASESQLLDFLKNILPEVNPEIQAFIQLKIGLLKWAKTNGLEKDWLLRYTYEFLRQFSDTPDLKVSNIEVPYLQSRSLAGFPFEFKFDGWLAGDEDKEVYEERLRIRFEAELENYFQSIGKQFNLKDKKKVTNPRNYERVKWLVRWTVQGWRKDQILEEIDREIQDQGQEKYYSIRTIELAFQQFKEYNLPVRA